MPPRRKPPKPRPYYEQTRWEVAIIAFGGALMVIGPLFLAPFSEPEVSASTWFFFGLGIFAGGWVAWAVSAVLVQRTRKKVSGSHLNEAAWWAPERAPTTQYALDQEVLHRELPQSEWPEVDDAVALAQGQANVGALGWWVGVDGGLDAMTLHILEINKQGFTIGLGDPDQYSFMLGKSVVVPFDTETVDHSTLDHRLITWLEWKYRKIYKRDVTQIERVTGLNESFGKFVDRSFAVQSRVARLWGLPGISKKLADYFLNNLMASDHPSAELFRSEWKKDQTRAVEKAFRGWLAHENPRLQVALGHSEQKMEGWREKALGLQTANTFLRAENDQLRGIIFDLTRADREYAHKAARRAGAPASDGAVFDEASRAAISQEG